MGGGRAPLDRRREAHHVSGHCREGGERGDPSAARRATGAGGFRRPTPRSPCPGGATPRARARRCRRSERRRPSREAWCGASGRSRFRRRRPRNLSGCSRSPTVSTSAARSWSGICASGGASTSKTSCCVGCASGCGSRVSASNSRRRSARCCGARQGGRWRAGTRSLPASRRRWKTGSRRRYGERNRRPREPRRRRGASHVLLEAPAPAGRAACPASGVDSGRRRKIPERGAGRARGRVASGSSRWAATAPPTWWPTRSSKAERMRRWASCRRGQARTSRGSSASREPLLPRCGRRSWDPPVPIDAGICAGPASQVRVRQHRIGGDRRPRRRGGQRDPGPRADGLPAGHARGSPALPVRAGPRVAR